LIVCSQPSPSHRGISASLAQLGKADDAVIAVEKGLARYLTRLTKGSSACGACTTALCSVAPSSAQAVLEALTRATWAAWQPRTWVWSRKGGSDILCFMNFGPIHQSADAGAAQKKKKVADQVPAINRCASYPDYHDQHD
jgi:hypothetical protein